MPIQLRPATRTDLTLLRSWDEQEHVRAADPNGDWRWEQELGRELDWREQLIAELDGEPIGFIEIIDPALEEQRYWGEVPDNLRALDIWIGVADKLGQGHGSAMMRLALARCFAPPAVQAVLVDPLQNNIRAHNFYERLGFVFQHHRRFGLDDCSVYQLTRERYLAQLSGKN